MVKVPIPIIEVLRRRGEISRNHFKPLRHNGSGILVCDLLLAVVKQSLLFWGVFQSVLSESGVIELLLSRSPILEQGSDLKLKELESFKLVLDVRKSIISRLSGNGVNNLPT